MQPAYVGQPQPYPYYPSANYYSRPPDHYNGAPNQYFQPTYQSNPRVTESSNTYYAPRVQNTAYPAFTVPSAGAQTPAPRTQTLARPPSPGAKPKALPRKSALKNTGIQRSTSESVPLVRTRTNSAGKQAAVPNTNTSSVFVPHHIFLTFHGTNEFLLDNIPSQVALDEIRQEIFPLWDVEFNDFQDTTWRVRFKNNPWSTTGQQAITAWKVVTELFKLLARRGYSYLTSVDVANQMPRLTFIVASPDESADFFLAYFSRSGHRVTLINPPPHVSNLIVPHLRAALPHKIAADRVSEDNVHVIELKRNGIGAPEVGKILFMTHVLKQIHTLGYLFQAAVPMARRGILGFGHRKEIWVFRGSKS